MYALDTISFPGLCGSYEEIHGWSQSHYVDFIVKHHVNHFRFQSLFYSIYGLTIEGLSFSAIEQYVKLQRQQIMNSVQLKVISMLDLHCGQLSGDLQAIIWTYKSHVPAMIYSANASLQILLNTGGSISLKCLRYHH